jgi:hypothetical protein
MGAVKNRMFLGTHRHQAGLYKTLKERERARQRERKRKSDREREKEREREREREREDLSEGLIQRI